MNIGTKFLGINIASPIIAGSCTLSQNIDNLIRMEDAGAGAVILKSIYEEEIIYDIKKNTHIVAPVENYGESYRYVADHAEADHLEKHFEMIRKAKERLSIPVIGSIDCYSHDSWITYARNFEQAGCDGLELNLSLHPYETSVSYDDVERVYSDIVRTMRKVTNMPIALKMSRQFTDMAKFMQQFSWMGIQGMTLFSSPMMLDIDLENQTLIQNRQQSSQRDLHETIHWISILSQKMRCPISASNGIHTADDAVKAILAGAGSVQIVSELIQNGIESISAINSGIRRWMEAKGYQNLSDFQGLLSIKSNANASMRLRTTTIAQSIE